MIDFQCEINFNPGPLTPASKLKEVNKGTGGVLTWQSPGLYRVDGPPSGGKNVRALMNNGVNFLPVVTGDPLQGWAGGVFDFPAFPTAHDKFTFSAFCVKDAGGTVGTYHPAMVGVSKVGSDWFFAVFRDREFDYPTGRVVGTVPLVVGQQYIWVQTHLLVSSGVCAEGWLYDIAGAEVDHVAITGNLIGPEFQQAVKLGAYNGFNYTGAVYRVYEYWWGAGNGPHPGPKRV